MTFCFYLLGSLGLQTMNTDAAVPGLNRSNVYRLDGAWGTPELRRAFDEIVAVKRRKIFANDEENRTLAATRDLLLPRLMSGELRVRDAEPLVAEVA
jgi:type I restriction enzyme S subunit